MVVVVVVVGLDKCVTDAMSHKCSQPREDAVSTLCHVSRYGAISCLLSWSAARDEYVFCFGTRSLLRPSPLSRFAESRVSRQYVLLAFLIAIFQACPSLAETCGYVVY